MDVESLQKVARPRPRCLDVFLVVSITVLFMVVGAAAAGGVILAMEIRSERLGTPNTLTTNTEVVSSVYKMQNFAYLQANSSQVENSTMTWSPVYYGAGTSIGSRFSFNAEHHSLQPKQQGNYFIYLDLKFSCTYKCKAGLLTVQLGSHLNCSVQLPEWAEATPVSRKCWTVARMDGVERLVAQMIVPEAGLANWKLDLTSSGQGIFLVD